MNTSTLEGRCACGEFRSRLTSPPLIVHCCRCTWCQRETGTALAGNAAIEPDRLELLAGTVEVVDTPSENGVGQKISRCPRCKVASWSNYRGGGDRVRFVRVGTLEPSSQRAPDIHIFTRSKQPWVVLPAGVPAFDASDEARDPWPADHPRRRERLHAKAAA